MRIFFTGSQGTGKSTLVNLLEIKDHKKFDSISSLFMKDSTIQTKYGSKEWFDFQRKISLKCLDIYVNERDFICSRSYFDSIAYPQRAGDRKLVSMTRYYEDLLFDKDTYYFYLPIEFEISKEGNELRSTDREYQRQIDSIIEREFQNLSLKYGGVCDNFYTLTGSIEERLSKVYEILELW